MRKTFGFNHPTRALILGDLGSGKTATMHYMAEEMHNDVKSSLYNPKNPIIPVTYWAPFSIYKKRSQYPAWLNMQHYKYGKILPNHINMIDDAQILLHAREWHKRGHIKFDKLLTLARHRKATLLISTQQSFRVDRNVCGLSEYLVCKEPQYWEVDEEALLMERAEIKPIIYSVITQFQELKIPEGEVIQQYSYVVGTRRKGKSGWVGPTPLPSYWQTELGDW